MKASSSKRDVVIELHKPARKNFKRRHVIIKGLNDLYQADLAEMQTFAKVNRGYRYILVVINTFSKFVWALPLKSKTGEEVAKAIATIFTKPKNIPKNLQTDLGKEFYNKHFTALMNKFNINHYSSYSTLKSSIAERVIRTLKSLLYKEFSLRGNYKWLDVLPEIVNIYNHRRHSTTGYKPVDVNTKNEKQILNDVYDRLKTIDPKKPKFKVGDAVRVSKYRNVFDKSYTPNWSTEIFEVDKMQTTNPRTYLLRDSRGELIRGGFYDYELQKVKHKDVYLVEKVLRKKKNQLYVKWLGLDKSHNSWIKASDVQ